MEKEGGTKRFVTVREFCSGGEWPTEPALRKLIFNEQANGLHKHIRRIGGRVLIDPQGFWDWVDTADQRHCSH